MSKPLNLKNLFICKYSDRVAVGWNKNDKNSEFFFNLFCNFGAADGREPNSTGTIDYITLTKTKLIEVFRDFALMHSIRNGKRRSFQNATARAKNQVIKLWKNELDFISRDYSLDGVLNSHKVFSGDFGGVDSSDWRESYINYCVLG